MLDEARDSKKEIQDLTEKREQLRKELNRAVKDETLKETARQTQELTEKTARLKDAQERLRKMKGYRGTDDSYIKQLQENMQSWQAQLQNLEKGSDEYEQVLKRIQNLQTGINDRKMFKDTSDEDIQRTEAEIADLTESITKLKEVSASGAKVQIQDTEEITNLKNELQEAERQSNSLEKKMQNLGDSVSELKGKTSFGARLSGGLTALFGDIFSRTLQPGTILKNLGSGIANVGSKVKGIASQFLKLGSAALVFNVVRKGLSVLREGVSEAFGAFLTADTTLGNSIAELKTSLATLQGSLASAFAPIVQAVIPYISSMVNWLITAANAVAQFTAALFGKTSYKKANAISATGAAASDAADSVSELNEQLGAYDELNVIGSNAGSGGAGGGGTGTDTGISYTDVGIADGISEFAQKVKEAWMNADFTEVGQIVGTKLKEALDSIDWSAIKESCNRVAKSIATFLNGFIGTEGLFASIGSTLAEAINTALEFALTFLESFDFMQFGTKIAEGIAGFFTAIDYGNIAGIISEKWIGMMDLISGFLQGIRWEGVFQTVIDKIVEFVNGIKWEELFSSAADLLVSAVLSMFDLGATVINALKRFAEDIFDSVTEYFSEEYNKAGGDLEEMGKNIIEGIFEGIVDWMTGIGTWLDEHILQPLIEGFKEAFDIHSPSRDPKLRGIGSDMIEGVFEGAIKWMKDIKSWIKKNIFGKFVDAWGKVGETVELGVELVKDGWTSLTEFVGEIGEKKFSLGKKGWSDITTYAGEIKTRSFALGKSGWSTISGYVGNIGSKSFELARGSNWRWGISSFVGDIGTKSFDITARFTNRIDALSYSQKQIDMTARISNAVLKGGGIVALTKATGGIFNGRTWQDIPQYKSGTLHAGSVFVAGEAGAEAVGHINGKTEVLNQSQIAAVIASAMASTMGEISNRMAQVITGHMTLCTNTLIENVGMLQPAFATAAGTSGSMAIDMNALADAFASRLSGTIELNNTMYLDGQVVYDRMVEVDRTVLRQTGKSGFGG